jgi:ketosteroid isomerase-like protein
MDAEFVTRFMNEVRQGAPADEARRGNHRILTSLYDALIRGDYEGFGQLLADDVELDIRGAGPMDGKWTGRRPVLEAVRANFSQLAEQRPQIECMLWERDCAAVLFRESGKFHHEGRDYRARVVQWFTFDRGKVTKIDEIVAMSTA